MPNDRRALHAGRHAAEAHRARRSGLENEDALEGMHGVRALLGSVSIADDTKGHTMTTVHQVNPWHLHHLLQPLTGLADDDDAVQQYRSVNPNSSTEVRSIIRELFIPNLESMTEDSLAHIETALRHYLSSDDINWSRLFNSILPPFDHPDNPRDFFIWIWEECFPGRSFQLEDLDCFQVVSDLNAANRTFKRRPQ